jgi:hypothetical protein
MQITVSVEILLSVLIVLGGLAVGWGLMRGGMKSVELRVAKLEEKHDTHVEKLDKLCNDVSALVARIDMIFTLGRADAIATRART